MVFLLLVSVLFLANCYRVSNSSCTQVTIWIIRTNEKLILILQVRQVISLVTSHPYFPFCRHIIHILHFILIENIFGGFISFVKGAVAHGDYFF